MGYTSAPRPQPCAGGIGNPQCFRIPACRDFMKTPIKWQMASFWFWRTYLAFGGDCLISPNHSQA